MIDGLGKYWELIKSMSLYFSTRTSDRRHIFVTGAPRSGTTLLKEILTAHPLLAGPDYESTGIFKIRNYYEYSSGEIENGWVNLSLNEYKDITEFYDDLSRQIIDTYGGRYFVDKIWPKKLRVEIVKRKFPRARWVHIVRHGPDSYCSALENPHVPQSRSVESFAKYWSECNNLIERNVPDERKVTLKYENLVREVEKNIRNIMNFLELKFYMKQTEKEYISNTSVSKRKYHRMLEEEINDKSVGRSQYELTNEDIKKFKKVAGSEMRRYSYVA